MTTLMLIWTWVRKALRLLLHPITVPLGLLLLVAAFGFWEALRVHILVNSMARARTAALEAQLAFEKKTSRQRAELLARQAARVKGKDDKLREITARQQDLIEALDAELKAEKARHDCWTPGAVDILNGALPRATTKEDKRHVAE